MIDDEHLASLLELEAGALVFALSHPELAGMTLAELQERFAQSPRLNSDRRDGQGEHGRSGLSRGAQPGPSCGSRPPTIRRCCG